MFISPRLDIVICTLCRVPHIARVADLEFVTRRYQVYVTENTLIGVPCGRHLKGQCHTFVPSL